MSLTGVFVGCIRGFHNMSRAIRISSPIGGRGFNFFGFLFMLPH
jgi:hypothetical protein